MGRKRLIGTMLLALVSVMPGCTYMEFWTKKIELGRAVKDNPSIALQRELTPENVLSVYGSFEGLGKRKEPLLIVAVSKDSGKAEIVSSRILFSPDVGYALGLLKGTYDVFILADVNGDGWYDQGEVVGRTPETAPLKVSEGKSVNGAIDGPVIGLDFARPSDLGLALHVKKRTSGLIYSSLDDEFFDPKYGTMGLWQVKEFMDHNQGMFFGLEEFNPSKVIVVFVHGVTGTPRDWKYFAENLDRTRFQPWFYYYPSAMPLDKLGAHLATVIQAMDQLSKGKMDRVVVVAHSMGGLVARAAINDLTRRGTTHYLKLYISLSTPYNGHDAAKMGVEYAPAVVPSWIDVVPDSKFLVRLHEQPLPPNMPFHLFFGFNDMAPKKGMCSDSTITLRSQLDPRAQFAAARIYGYDDTHEGILLDKAVMKQFNKILDTVAAK